MTLVDVDNTGYASSRALRRAFERRAELVPESVWRRFAPPSSRVMSRRFSYGASDCSATGPECPQHAARLRRNALPGVAAKASRAATERDRPCRGRRCPVHQQGQSGCPCVGDGFTLRAAPVRALKAGHLQFGRAGSRERVPRTIRSRVRRRWLAAARAAGRPAPRVARLTRAPRSIVRMLRSTAFPCIAGKDAPTF